MKNNSDVIIRIANLPEDFAAIIDIWQNAGNGIHLGKSDTIEEIKKKQTRDPDLFLVAVINQTIVGTVLGGFDGRRGLVYHMAVEEEFRNKGVGSLLLSELESRLIEKGCIRCYLLIVPENHEALDFYIKKNWDKLDLFVMGKDLLK